MANQFDLACGRRDFLKYTGLGVSVLALGSAGFITNANAASLSGLSQEAITTDVLVIGGGLAGVLAAIKAKQKGMDVTLVDKGQPGKSGLSPFFGAMNGFPKALAEKSKETVINGQAQTEEYLTNRPYVGMWVEDSEDRINELKDWGVVTDSGNDKVKLRDVLSKNDVRILERVMMTTLVKKDNRIAGAVGFPLDEEKAVVIKTKAVILCAGAGALKTPGFPAKSLTHDGDMMAYRVGAELSGKEFCDYHSTLLEDPGGHGVTNDKNTALDTIRVSVSASPRFETRAAMQEVYDTHQEGFSYFDPDARSSPAPPPPGGAPPATEGRGDRPPGGAPVAGIGFEGTSTWGSTAGASPHKCEGIFPRDDKCSSNIDGLYAAGDNLCVLGALYGMGGASAILSAVQGARAGEYAAEYASTVKTAAISKSEIRKEIEAVFAPRKREKGYSPKWVTQVLQGVMVPYYVLAVKKADRLEAALSNVRFLREHFAPKLLAGDLHDLRLVHETRNLLLNAEMKLRASLLRTESRGSHYREDYPARDDRNWLAWIKIKQENGQMKLTKVPVPDEWKPDASKSYKERYPNVRFPGEEDYIKSKGIS